ncbi:MAG TPA: fluoride efflux transporter CrcB [Thermoanaerobaculia bacterium]|jgi:CrcB protein|nr:fluoride efflux transporter CrcB [Thermoanaerobaculia bacterium]
MKWIYVGAGGFLGAIARYAVGGWISSRYRGQFPVATFVINVTGSFVLGLFLTIATERIALDPRWRLFVAVGFVGAYTTFSTFEYESERLAAAGGFWLAGVNLVGSVIVGFLAVWLGSRLAVRF